MRTRPAAAVAIASLALAGCLKTNDVATLDAKGGGTLVQTYEVDVAMAKELRDLAAMRRATGGATSGSSAGGMERLLDADLFSTETTHALAKGVEGFRLRGVVDETKEGRRKVEVKADFDSLEAVVKAGRFPSETVELAKNADGSWTLSFQHAGVAAWLDMFRGPDGKLPPEVPGEADLPMVTAMLENYLGPTFSAKRTLKVPGKVLETSGAKSEDGTSVTWSAGFTELMGKGVTHKVTFQAEGLALKAFKAKPDYADLGKRILAAMTPAEPKEGTAPVPAGPSNPPSGDPPPPTTPTPVPGMGG